MTGNYWEQDSQMQTKKALEMNKRRWNTGTKFCNEKLNFTAALFGSGNIQAKTLEWQAFMIS